MKQVSFTTISTDFGDDIFLGIIKDADFANTKQKIIEAFSYNDFADIHPSSVITEKVPGIVATAHPDMLNTIYGVINELVGEEVIEGVEHAWEYTKYEEYNVFSFGGIDWASKHKHSDERVSCDISSDTLHVLEAVAREDINNQEMFVLNNLQKAIDYVKSQDEVDSEALETLLSLQKDLTNLWLRDYTIQTKDEYGNPKVINIQACDEDHANEIMAERDDIDLHQDTMTDSIQFILVLVKPREYGKQANADRLHIDQLMKIQKDFGVDVSASIKLGRLDSELVQQIGMRKLSDIEVTLESGMTCELHELLVF